MPSIKKKRLAREFLIFLGSCALFALCWGIMMINNSIRKKKIDNLNREQYEISKRIPQLRNEFEKKEEQQKWLWNEMDKYFIDLGNFESFRVNWKGLSRVSNSDSLSDYWHNRWTEDQRGAFIEIGFGTPKALQNFISTNSISDLDSINLNEASSLEIRLKKSYDEEISLSNKMVFPKNYMLFLVVCGSIIFGIAYPLRLIFLATRWSIRTLREGH